MAASATRPLDGLLVVALEQAVAAPLCTMRLADAGARVIKIERPEGDFARGYDSVVHGESAYFVWLNRGKESLVLNIKDPADTALLDRILARADVFVQNLAPGAAERAGFGSAALRARHPSLITVDISGYGEDGEAAGMKAYDFLIQCEAGLAAVTGTPDAAARVGVSVADIACGMNAHAAVLEALLARGRTGKGAGIAVSLFDGVADWMAVPLLHHDYGGKAPGRSGLAHPSIAPYGAFACNDGRLIVIAIQNEREWAAFCEGVMDDPALALDHRFASNALRTANRATIDGLVADRFASLSLAEARSLLDASRTAYGAVNEVADLSGHPALRRIAVESPSGPVSLPAPAIRMLGEERSYRAIPAVGSHSDAIRAEFG
jgi:crotonobetainyl-CoA:carnitine CoA-transferase CaiB-like acyl-CoA transferase